MMKSLKVARNTVFNAYLNKRRMANEPGKLFFGQIICHKFVRNVIKLNIIKNQFQLLLLPISYYAEAC